MEQLPDGRAVCEQQLLALLERVVNTSVNEEAIADYFHRRMRRYVIWTKKLLRDLFQSNLITFWILMPMHRI